VANTFPLPKALAFTTIPGGDLADIILLGSEAADTVVLNTSQTIVANGFGGDDSITIANPTVATGGNESTFTAPSTIYGGEGDDSLLLANLVVGSSAILGGAGNDFFASRNGNVNNDYQAAEVNGNEGEDTFGATGDGIRAIGSQILGGSNNDTIWAGASTATEFNGNKNLDRINVIGNQIGGSIFGGKGIDFIDTANTVDVTYTGTSIAGGNGNDVISDSEVTIVADNSTLTVLGGEGVDNITLSINNDGGGVREAALIGGGTEDDFITIDGSITATRLTIQGGDGNDTIEGFGNINGGSGADAIAITADANLLYAMTDIATETGLTTATIDSITGFGAGDDTIKTGVAATAGNYQEAAAQAGFAAALNAANVFFTTAGNEDFQYYLLEDSSAAVAGTGYIFFKNTTTAAVATAAIQINEVLSLTTANIIA
jgi:hypothetical protein